MLRYGPIDRATSERTREGCGALCSTSSASSKDVDHCTYMGSVPAFREEPQKGCSRVFEIGGGSNKAREVHQEYGKFLLGL